MTYLVNDLLTRVTDTLQDDSHIKWSLEELLRYLNDARRTVAIFRPDLYATKVTHVLVQGGVQTVPTDGLKFLNGIRNVSAVGVIGRAVRIAQRETIDQTRPMWHQEAPSTDLRHFMIDERDPRTFYCYPPAAAGHKMDIIYAKRPVDIAIGDVLTADLGVEDVYADVFHDLVCYRAYNKDAEFAGNAERADRHLKKAEAVLGAGRKIDLGTSPNTANQGGKAPRTA